MKTLLAHVNIGMWKPQATQSDYANFVEIGAKINQHIAAQPHLKWQFGTQFYQDPNVLAVFGEPRMILNLSVWDDFAALKTFVYQHAHLNAIQKRDAWFEKLTRPSYTLWWVTADTMPSLEDAKARLQAIAEKGPSFEAFDFNTAFLPSGELMT